MIPSGRWWIVRVAVWIGALIWAAYLMNQPGKTNALAQVGAARVGPADPGLVVTALEAVAVARCPVELGSTLHVTVGPSGLQEAWVQPGVTDPSCLAGAVWGQTWPALRQELQMEWPLG